MAGWTSDELNKIATAEELEIAPEQENGALRNPTTIWVVRVGDELFVRSWRGQDGFWFSAAGRSKQGRIWAGGLEKEVSFEEVEDSDLNDQVDAAYESKYSRYPQYVRQMVAAEQRSTTLKLVPRELNEAE